MPDAAPGPAGFAQPEPKLPPPLEPMLRLTGGYIASEALKHAEAVALMLGQPLLLTGDPGTGKTTFARELADRLFGGRILEMQVKSNATREDLLYKVDELARFRDAQPGRPRLPLLSYFELRPLGEAIVRACPSGEPLADRSGRPIDAAADWVRESFGHVGNAPAAHALLKGADAAAQPERWVVLIDEIDKAPRDVPNDLLEELERLSFGIPELGVRVVPPANAPRPVVIITSNSEKSLPDAFLRRCVFHHIEFPDQEGLLRIVGSRLAGHRIESDALDRLTGLFLTIRSRLGGKLGTAELLQWLSLVDRRLKLRTMDDLAAHASTLATLVAVLGKQQDDERVARSVIEGWKP